MVATYNFGSVCIQVSKMIEEAPSVWHVRRCNIVCGNKCVVYRKIYGLKIYLYHIAPSFYV